MKKVIVLGALALLCTVLVAGAQAGKQATVVKLAVEEGQQVVKGDLLVVLEAMKMEQPLTAHTAGTVSGISAEVGQTVPSGHRLLDIV